MKKILPLALFVLSAILVGCSADKSDATQTMAPTGGKAYDAPQGGTATNPNIPAAAKSAIPGAGK